MFRTLPNNQTYIYFEIGTTASSGPKTEEQALEWARHIWRNARSVSDRRMTAIVFRGKTLWQKEKK